MIKKLTVLVIEKADGTMEFRAGEKGEIAELARSTEHALNDARNRHDVFRLCAFGPAGLFREAKWKFNAPTEVVVPVVTPASATIPQAPAEAVAIPADEPDDLPEFEGDPDSEDEAESAPDEEAEKVALRKKLRDAGVSYSPRSGLECLRGLADKNGL